MIVRCELALPSTNSSSSSESPTALMRAKEGRCWACGLCANDQGCPSKPGVWYSDTLTTQAAGCGFDPQQGYMAHRVYMYMHPGTKILLATFEVCGGGSSSSSSPAGGSYFKPEYEQAKAKSAMVCEKGRCPG